jgi:hypothetical protein
VAPALAALAGPVAAPVGSGTAAAAEATTTTRALATATAIGRTTATTTTTVGRATAAAEARRTTATTGEAAAAATTTGEATTATTGEAALAWGRTITAAAARWTTCAALALHRRVAADAAAIERGSVHRLQRRVPRRVVGEAHEAEAAAASGVAVLDHDRVGDVAKGLKRRTQRRVVGRPRQSTNKQLHSVLFLFSFADPSPRKVEGRLVALVIALPGAHPRHGGTSRVTGGVIASLESYQ